MTTILKKLYSSMMASMEVEGLKIPITAVKFFSQKENAPDVVMENHIGIYVSSGKEGLSYMFKYLPSILEQLRSSL